MAMQVLICWLLAQNETGKFVESVVKAAGGRERLLETFELRETTVLSADLDATGRPRVSVLQVPGRWYLGKRDRVSEDNEPAAKLVWAWSLRAFLDPASKLEALPAKDGLVGIRIRGSIEPPMDVWFEPKERKLAAIDWRNDRHVFSEWRELDGLRYPSRVVGHKADGRVWYHTRILEIKRLKGCPPAWRAEGLR